MEAGEQEEEEEEVQDYRVKCLNNLATTQLKLEQNEEALHSSRDVLALEPNNVKALFRAGKVRPNLRCNYWETKQSISYDLYQPINDYCRDLLEGGRICLIWKMI